MFAHLRDVSIRSLVVALSAVVILWILQRRRTAALEHAVWAAVVCGMLALFSFGPALPRFPLHVLENSSASVPNAAPDAPLDSLIPGENHAATLLQSPGAAPAANRPSVGWRSVAGYAYAAIAFAFLARFTFGVFLARRLLAQTIPCTDADGIYESKCVAVPVTVGWLRPKVLLPLEWREWDREKMDTVLAHERAHARRRDGLVAALAALNRCLFWFHPLAWMLERRLALLAEQACDDSCVAELGDGRRYARVLLETAMVVDWTEGRLRRHALTMATGSHVRQRVESLMKEGRTFSRGLNGTGWAAIVLCGVTLVWSAGAVDFDRQSPLPQPAIHRWKAPVPPLFVTQDSPRPPARIEFEVASVKPSVMSTGGGTGGRTGVGCMEALKIGPGRVEFACTFVGDMIVYAFRLPIERVIAPDWVKDRGGARFDVEAKLGQSGSRNQVPEMFQALLADRFKLAVHRATAEQPVLALVVARGGLKLNEAPPELPPSEDIDPAPANISVLGGVETRSTREPNPDLGFTTTYVNPRIGTVKVTDRPGSIRRWDAPRTTLEGLADLLGRFAPGVDNIVDMTGLKGRYQVVLEVSMNDMLTAMPAPGGDSAARGDAETDMASAAVRALNKGLLKLGLQLERRKGTVETLAVDHVEKTPTGN